MTLRWVDWAMVAFLAGMTAMAIAVWGAGVVVGTAPVFAAMGPSAVSLFVVGHMPALAAGVILWRAHADAMGQPWRVILKGATVYFAIACIMGVAGNFLYASLVNGFTPSAR